MFSSRWIREADVYFICGKHGSVHNLNPSLFLFLFKTTLLLSTGHLFRVLEKSHAAIPQITKTVRAIYNANVKFVQIYSTNRKAEMYKNHASTFLSPIQCTEKKWSRVQCQRIEFWLFSYSKHPPYREKVLETRINAIALMVFWILEQNSTPRFQWRRLTLKWRLTLLHVVPIGNEPSVTMLGRSDQLAIVEYF